MKPTSCLICRNDAADRLAQFAPDPYHRHLEHLREAPVTYVICRHCGFVYTNPMLDEAELETLYRDKLRPAPPNEAYLAANRKVYLRRYHWAAGQLGLPSERQAEPSILEVGCAAGVALSVFREYGWRTAGIEPADTFAAHAREVFRLDVQTGFYGPGSYEGRTFDLILFSQVLEHVPDPDLLLAQARVNLAEDGHLFIGVPTLMRPMRPVHPMTLQAVHLWIFSLPTLTRLLARHGFAVTGHSYDAKGLLVLAKKAPAPAALESGAGDDPARVARYFTDYTDPESLYGRNLAALQAGDKWRLRGPDMDADLSALTVEAGPDGQINVAEGQGARIRRLYDGDPRGKAEQWAQRLSLEADGVVICMGLGLGYLPEAILARLKHNHILLICEADPRLFRAALFHRDLTGLLGDERVFLVVGEDEGRLDQILGRISKQLYVSDKLRIVRCQASMRWNRGYYDRMEARVQDRLKVLEINKNTIGRLGQRMFKNTLDNAHLTHGMPGVSRFAGLFEGCPAIIVSAGPSLEKNLPQLKAAKGRAVIIACDTVLRLLVPHGIVPDVTITADPHEATYRKFRDLPMDDEAILICHPASYPDIYRTFGGRRFTTETHSPIYRFLRRFWPEKGRLDMKSQSSAHQAFNFAKLIKADPIIFVGQDLCYYDSKKHAGTLTQGSPYAQSEQKQLEPAVDILGQPVQTSILFLSFKIILEDLIKDCPARIINATEGGLGLKGTEVMALADAIAECCPAPIGIAERLPGMAEETAEGVDLDGLRAEVRRLHEDGQETMAVVRKMLTYVKRAQREISRGRADGRRARHLSEMAERESALMADREELMSLLVEGAYLLELYMTREETLAIDQIADEQERFRKQIQRALTYYAGLNEVLPLLVDGTKRLLERLDEQARLAQLPRETAADCLRLALGYKELEDYPRAKRWLRCALERDPQNMEARFHLGDLLFRCHRPEEALPLLEDVAARRPRFKRVEEVIQGCRDKAAAWEQKLAEGRRVGAAGQPGAAELASFYHQAGQPERAAAKLRQRIAAAPADPQAYLDLMRLHEETGDLVAAMAVFEESLTALPEHPVLLLELGLFSLRRDRADQAELFFRAAAGEDPALAEQAGDALCAAGLFLSAGDLYGAAAQYRPADNRLVMKAAAAYSRAAGTSEARRTTPQEVAR